MQEYVSGTMIKRRYFGFIYIVSRLRVVKSKKALIIISYSL